MELKFECPTCGQHISATHAQIGVTATCPNCNAAITVPNASTLPPPLPRPAAAPLPPVSLARYLCRSRLASIQAGRGRRQHGVPWSLAFTPILARSSRRSALQYSHSKSPRSSQCSAAQAAKIFSSFAVLLLPPVSPVKQNRPCRAPALLRADNGTIPSSFQIGVPEKVLDIFQFARFLIHQ